jgi:hypothetical protein
MTIYTNPFTGQSIYPTTVSYEALSLTANTLLQWPINGNTTTPVSSIIDVTATVNSSAPTIGWLLELPPASQVSTGQSVLVRNIGSNVFTVTDNSGNTIITIASGVAQYIFLTDNTSVNGVWSSFVFGAGTSSANSSALAGSGLVAQGTTLNQAYNVSFLYSTPYAVQSSNRATFLVWSGGVGQLNFPSAASLGNNWFTIVRNNGTGILTLATSGSDVIDGNSSQQLQLTESLVIVANGSGSVGTAGFNTFAYGRSNAFPYTQLVKSVTGAGANITLTAAEGSNTIQEYVGNLSQNTTITVPSTVQLYSFQNQTVQTPSGSTFTLTFKTAGSGTTVAVANGSTAFCVCDGTNVFSTAANTSTSGNFTANTGTVGSPSITFSSNTSTGFYLPTSNTIGFAISGVDGMVLNSSGLVIAQGISGGVF